MSIPTHRATVIAEGLARLTSLYSTKKNVRAMVTALLTPFQEIQDVAYAVYTGRMLSTAILYALPQTNSVLDAIGKLVGQPRLLLDDQLYQALLYLRIAVNRATGNPSDWARFARVLLQTSGGPVEYYDGTDASIFFFVGDMTLPPTIVARVLADALPNGVRGDFAYSTWPDGDDFEWSDVNDPTSGQGGWGDTGNPAIGGLLVSALEMSP